MPFETGLPVRRKIAVIGGGISGMGAAYELGETHDVTLIEAEPRLGGHARTVVAGKHGDQPVDTGFIVFNYANYPNLARIFGELDVPVVESNMSFGASVRGGGLEYGLASFDAVFAQRRNMVNPRFIGMLRDIFRFNAQAPAKAASHKDHSIGDFLDELGTGNWFRDYYLMPLSGAIWSTPKERIMDFPAQALIQFFENHALMNYAGQHQWYTVAGGSISYVERLERAMRAQGVQMRLGSPVDAVRRTASGPEVKMHGGDWDTFDEVIFATHSDDTLRLLSDPTEAENASLGVIGYQPNDVVLHADPNVMPRKRAVWSSWNYSEAPAKRDGQIDITYWMNRLQPIPQEDPHFVTLNSTRPIREELIYDQVTLRHPVYDLAALRAQAQVRAMNGANNTWFCGAWMRNGFHEDGLSSGLDVAEAINARALSAQVAAE